LGFKSRRTLAETVEICSVDPAPSLDDIFQAKIGDMAKPVLGDERFLASELDSSSLFKSWISEMRASIDETTTANVSGVHIDLSFEHELFSELLELVPPGVDEILAVFRIVELLGDARRKVVIDMAPTGHALELLRTPDRMRVWSRLLLKTLAAHRKLALAREAAVKVAELEMRARELARDLRSSKRSLTYVVMLPELLPDRETERLVNELESLELATEAIIVNRVLLPDRIGACSQCGAKAEAQQEVLVRLRRKFTGRRIYVVPDWQREVAGREGLKELTSELWELK
jgi:arsenite-transporting ATPase